MQGIFVRNHKFARNHDRAACGFRYNVLVRSTGSNAVGAPRTTGDSAFLLESERSLHALRGAMRRLLEGAPVRVRRAADLQRGLRVRAPLAWQVFRLARSEDVLGAVAFVPLADAMGKVLDAAERGGFSARAIGSVRDAYEKFEAVVARHAGNRATFEAMLSEGGGNEVLDLKTRRAAFRASAQLWGIQARLTYRCMIMGIEDSEPALLSAIIQGSIGLRTLRAGRSLPVCRRTITLTRSDKDEEFIPESTGPWLLEDFCSAELPRISTKRRGSVAHDFIEFSGVGLTAETDVFIATKLSGGMKATDEDAGVTSMIRVPTDDYVANMLVPVGVVDTASAATRIFGCLEDVSAAETAHSDYLLHPARPAEYLGRSLDALMCPEFPRCPELIRFVLRELGRGREEFDIFRCHIRFPMLHTCVGLRALTPTSARVPAEKGEPSGARAPRRRVSRGS